MYDVPAVPAVPAGRTLTRIEALVAGTPVSIATTHLEPGGNFDARNGQMEDLKETMKQNAAANCIVAGAYASRETDEAECSTQLLCCRCMYWLRWHSWMGCQLSLPMPMPPTCKHFANFLANFSNDCHNGHCAAATYLALPLPSLPQAT